MKILYDTYDTFVVMLEFYHLTHRVFDPDDIRRRLV